MPRPLAQQFDPANASLLLAGAMCVVPFLQPLHTLPIRTFYDEWLAFAFGLGAIAMAAAARRDAEVRLPALGLWLGSLALFLILRAFLADSAYAQSCLTWALYILFASLLVALGHDLATRFGQMQTCDAIATFLLIGSLANATAGVLQVIGVPPLLDSIVSYLHGKRAIGNVGQANLYANYLALGEASALYLYARGKLNTVAACSGGLLLLGAAALAASRTSILYASIFALLGCVTFRRGSDLSTRLCIGALAMATLAVLMQSAVPAGLSSLSTLLDGDFHRDPSLDPPSERDSSIDLRLRVWELAWDLFVSHPWLGVGPGEFAGASFAHGLAPEMAAEGIWTSPHNLILQLLSEAGLFAGLLAGAGLAFWVRGFAVEFLRFPTPASWWIAACSCVEFAHAMLEYPFWFANFLAVTALLMGVGAQDGMSIRTPAYRTALASSALGGFFILALAVRDYGQFDLASPVSAGRSLASERDVSRDRDVLRGLGRGLLASRSELWLFLAYPLDANSLAEKIAVGERVMRVWPSHQVVTRQSIFMALDNRSRDALSLLSSALDTYANRRAEIGALVDAAPPGARTMLQPALKPILR